MREGHTETHPGMAHTDAPSSDGHAGYEDHTATGRAGMHHEMKPAVTRPQLAVVGLLTVLAFFTGFGGIALVYLIMAIIVPEQTQISQ